jgi:hypothetical protein
MVSYNRFLAMPWDGLNPQQKAESLKLAFLAGREVGSDRAANHNDRAATNFNDFDEFVLQDDQFNQDFGGGDDSDQPEFTNTWKPQYWANKPSDLRVDVFIAGCDEAKKEL